MFEKNGYRVDVWDANNGEDWEYAKKAILEILNSQKVSLSKTRYLFDCIVKEIEDKNPITI